VNGSVLSLPENTPPGVRPPWGIHRKLHPAASASRHSVPKGTAEIPVLALPYWGNRDYTFPMEIKLPHMPFKFSTPDGKMDITVRRGEVNVKGTTSELYAAAATFIEHGPRALERIQITPNVKTHREVMQTLVTGFVLNLNKYEKESLPFRVLEALSKAPGVVEVNN
jgi:hypothetical protein